MEEDSSFEEGVVLFQRKSKKPGSDDEKDDDDPDLWDDSELIKAYNKAVGLAYDAASSELKQEGHKVTDSSTRKVHPCKKTNGTSKKTKKKQRTKKEKINKDWKEGDVCLAPYIEDGNHYEARIRSVTQSGENCVVEYIGYEEKAEVTMSELLPLIASDVDASVDTSSVVEDEQGTSIPIFPGVMAHGTQARSSLSQIPVLPPPPPPNWLETHGGKPPSDQEALSSMLMSWYMSGYHTGYYQALREMRTSRENIGQKGVQFNRRKGHF